MTDPAAPLRAVVADALRTPGADIAEAILDGLRDHDRVPLRLALLLLMANLRKLREQMVEP